MFADRLEVRSPGGLPAGISKEEYLNGQISLLRNPILGNVFFRLKHIEKFGTGILRINNAYASALEKPAFHIFENSITVVLPVMIGDNSLTDTEKRIVDLLKKNYVMSRQELEKATGLKKDSVIRLLNSLIRRNIIQKTGKHTKNRKGKRRPLFASVMTNRNFSFLQTGPGIGFPGPVFSLYSLLRRYDLCQHSQQLRIQFHSLKLGQ